MKRQYEVTFAQGTSNEVRYPIEATSKQKAAQEFSRQYIGRTDSTLAKLVKVTLAASDEDEEEEVAQEDER